MQPTTAVRTGFDFNQFVTEKKTDTDPDAMQKLKVVFERAIAKGAPAVWLEVNVDFTPGRHRTEDRKKLVGLHYYGDTPIALPHDKCFRFTEDDLMRALNVAGWMVESKLKLTGAFRFRFKFVPMDAEHSRLPDPAIATRIGILRGVDAAFLEKRADRRALLSKARGEFDHA